MRYVNPSGERNQSLQSNQRANYYINHCIIISYENIAACLGLQAALPPPCVRLALDALAIQTAVLLSGDPPFRHLSGAGFLIMKAAAFNDRGTSAPHESKDLADIAVLLIGRPQLTLEVETAEVEMRRAVDNAAALLLAVVELAPALRGHFSDRSPIPPDTPDELTVEAIGVLEGLRGGV